MVPVLLAALLIGIVLVATRRIAVARRRAAAEQRRLLASGFEPSVELPPLPASPGFARPAVPSPDPIGSDRDSGSPTEIGDLAAWVDEPARARQPSPLPGLLAGVVFPDDMSPLTHGLSPADLELRLVLASRLGPAEIVSDLSRELERAGFAVGWLDEHHGAASRHDGSMLIELVPPPPVTDLAGSASRRGPGPTRPDHPTAPDGATVLVLESVPPVA